MLPSAQKVTLPLAQQPKWHPIHLSSKSFNHRKPKTQMAPKLKNNVQARFNPKKPVHPNHKKIPPNPSILLVLHKTNYPKKEKMTWPNNHPFKSPLAGFEFHKYQVAKVKKAYP